MLCVCMCVVCVHGVCVCVCKDLDVRLKKLVRSAPCMLFMKGTPAEPRCGRS